MKEMKFILFLILGMAVTAHAEMPYKDALEKSDISVEMPKGFHLLDIPKDSAITLTINPDYIPKYGYTDRNIGWAYTFGFESKNSNAVFLYPLVGPNLIKLGNVVEDELQADAGDSDLDITSMVTVVSDIPEYCNADTIFIYEFTLRIPYKDRYNHGVGVCLRKYAHPTLLLKLLLNDDGLTKKDEYMKILLSTVKFGNEITESGIAEEERLKETNWYFLSPIEHYLWKRPQKGFVN